MDIHTDTSHTTLRQRPLIFLDTETTSLVVQENELIEIGALKVEPHKPFKILDELNVKVKPNHLDKASNASLKIVQYSDYDWQDALSLKAALVKLDKFAEGGVLVGFNTSFDWGVLDRAYYKIGKYDPFYYHRLDVMPMAYLKLFGDPQIKRFSLGELCQFFKIDRAHKHQALDDTKATYQLFLKLMELK
ncbi:MAG: 3'-5' exonuclease [Patescibacteria group bacterium]|nr:3'-5' exonuclease [Patescibacteria group bacterium]